MQVEAANLIPLVNQILFEDLTLLWRGILLSSREGHADFWKAAVRILAR